MQANEFLPISAHHELNLLNSFSNEKNEYFHWLDEQANPPKSYLRHPFSSEAELNQHKKLFQRIFGLSLGAYIRIKRAYYLLNHNAGGEQPLSFSYLPTQLGMMIAISTNKGLCLLEFLERKMLENELLDILKNTNGYFVFKPNAHYVLAEQLNDYFAQKRRNFDLSLDLIGTSFQQQVWQCLQSIPYGKTCSYSDIARTLKNSNAVRAVANANGRNKVSILVPCHRVIEKNGKLGGYGGGIERKAFLLDLESGKKPEMINSK